MVEEIRQITLNSSELLRALNAYREANMQFMPTGKIINFTVTKKDIFTVVLSDEGGQRNVDFQFTDLLEPVITYCIANNVPLPWKSRKTITVRDGKAMLSIHIDHPPAQKPGQQSTMQTAV